MCVSIQGCGTDQFRTQASRGCKRPLSGSGRRDRPLAGWTCRSRDRKKTRRFTSNTEAPRATGSISTLARYRIARRGPHFAGSCPRRIAGATESCSQAAVCRVSPDAAHPFALPPPLDPRGKARNGTVEPPGYPLRRLPRTSPRTGEPAHP